MYPELKESESFVPNHLALSILKEMSERQKDRRETDGSRTQELIREARSGVMYDFPTKEGKENV